MKLSDTTLCQENTRHLHSNSYHSDASESAALPYILSSSKRLSQQELPSKPSLDRQNYVSSGVQTDLGGIEDWYESSLQHIPRRKHYISLTKRLLLRCQKDRERLEAERSSSRCTLHGKPGCDLQSSSPGETESEDMSRAVKLSLSKEIEMEEVKHSDDPEDSDMKDISHDPVADRETVHSSVPVQKPRPPDQEKGIGTLTIITEIHDSPRAPTSPQVPQTLSVQNHQVNGFPPNEMCAQPSSVPSIPHDSSLDSFSVHNRTSIPPLSPLIQISSSNPNISPANSCSPVYSTPVKKKISVGEYNILFRRKAESQSTSDKNHNFGSVLPHNSTRAAPAIKVHSKVAASDGTSPHATIKDLTQ